MSRILGSLFCIIRREHAWRRLRKAEWRGAEHAGTHPGALRICSRCLKVKSVKQRVKVAA